MAAILVASAIGGAAALSADTETTDTGTTSDIQSSTVATEPHNSSVVKNIEIIGDANTNTSSLANPGTEMKLEFVVNDSNSDQNGEVLHSTSSNWTQTTVSGAPDHYNKTVANNKWGDDLEYGGGENVTVDARLTFNESQADESVNNITYTVDPATGESAARVEFTGSENTVEGNKTVFGMSLPSILGGDDVGAAQVSDNVSVTSNTSTITLDIDNQSSANSFSEVANAGSSGDLSTIAQANVNGQTVPVFVESADASWLDANETYAVVSSDGSTITVKNANNTFDSTTTSIDVSATGNDAVGFFTTRSMLSDYGASTGEQITAASGAIDTNGDPFEASA